MARHTPGPWRVGSDIGAEGEYFVDAPYGTNGLSGKSDFSVGSQIVVRTRSEANARLIAAAPDLLTACIAVIDELGYVEGDKAQALCLAAIAKARGEAVRS